jgi:indolepyruvate ferredoxin oxidoreductase beta subunit
MEYPSDIEETLKAHAKVRLVKALELAQEAGNPRTANVVLLGAMAAAGNIPKEHWTDALKATVPAKFMDVNLKAFDLGYNSVS